MWRTSLNFLWVLLVALLGGCAFQPPATSTREPNSVTPAAADAETSAHGIPLAGEIFVFAAASLTDAFDQIAVDFQSAHADVTIRYNFAGSQQLAQQLGQAAPADVFASAHPRQMEMAIEVGRVVSGTQHTFAHNRLVVITPADNRAEVNTLHDLARTGVKLVLAAPEVPVGAYSLDFLNAASATVEYGAAYSQTVLANVVSYEANVRSVLSKVVLGEADAGIVYTSDIALDAGQIQRVEIPNELNTIAAYPIAPIVDSSNPVLAQAFVEYVLSPAGQAVLAAYGFMPVTAAASEAVPGANGHTK